MIIILLLLCILQENRILYISYVSDDTVELFYELFLTKLLRVFPWCLFLVSGQALEDARVFQCPKFSVRHFNIILIFFMFQRAKSGHSASTIILYSDILYYIQL